MENYNEFFINKSSPFANRTVVRAIDIDTQYELQGRTLKIGKPSFGTLIQITNTATGTNSVGNGTRLVATIDLTSGTGFPNRMNAGWPVVEVYQGSSAVGSMRIFPSNGSGIAPNAWVCQSGYRSMGGSELNTRFEVQLYNGSGATGTVFVQAFHKYLINGGGTSA